MYVIAKQWMWKLQHTDGKREINTLHVPAGKAVRLNMISEDVIHSFFAPAFRIKQDVLPGRYTTIWFKADKPGTYHLFCAEYCGTNHSQMTGWIYVIDQNITTPGSNRAQPKVRSRHGRKDVPSVRLQQLPPL